jgi:hypothetical protein
MLRARERPRPGTRPGTAAAGRGRRRGRGRVAGCGLRQPGRRRRACPAGRSLRPAALRRRTPWFSGSGTAARLPSTCGEAQPRPRHQRRCAPDASSAAANAQAAHWAAARAPARRPPAPPRPWPARCARRPRAGPGSWPQTASQPARCAPGGRAGPASMPARPVSGRASRAANKRPPSARQRSWAARNISSVPSGRRANASYTSPSQSTTTVARSAPAQTVAAWSAPCSHRKLSVSSTIAPRRWSCRPVVRSRNWPSISPRTLLSSASTASTACR